GTPARARFFGHSASLSRLGSGIAAPLSNAVLRSRAGRKLTGRLFGLSPRRTLPALANVPFETWWRRRPAGGAGIHGEVVLLVDPLTNYNYPAVGQAAVEFLEAVGVRVADAIAIDDGRAAFSKGLIGRARQLARSAVARLTATAQAGMLVIGLEPSSTLTLRDEYFYLLPGDPRVEAIARQTRTFEEFVCELDDRTALQDRFTLAEQRVLLHGHCHQKALIGTGPSRRALSLPRGYVVEEIDSGCCGMAGSFGYEADHYELSMKMAERRLLPAIRSADERTLIAAAGVSCRQQIADGTGRVALHPAEILRDALLHQGRRAGV
ncbi:MAG TPA: hypothetical protein VF434_11610, partial [Promineifilum sp.]